MLQTATRFGVEGHASNSSRNTAKSLEVGELTELEEALIYMGRSESEHELATRKAEQAELKRTRDSNRNASKPTPASSQNRKPAPTQSVKPAPSPSTAQSDDELAEEFILEHVGKLARGEHVSEQEEKLVAVLIKDPNDAYVNADDFRDYIAEEKELLAYTGKLARGGNPSDEECSHEEKDLLAYTAERAKTLR